MAICPHPSVSIHAPVWDATGHDLNFGISVYHLPYMWVALALHPPYPWVTGREKHVKERELRNGGHSNPKFISIISRHLPQMMSYLLKKVKG
jgi:hypothetical protein